jgi:hypothetical protein
MRGYVYGLFQRGLAVFRVPAASEQAKMAGFQMSTGKNCRFLL